jgi:hypothetical protein
MLDVQVREALEGPRRAALIRPRQPERAAERDDLADELG